MKWKLGLVVTAAWLLAPPFAEPCSCAFPPDHGFLIEHATELPRNASGIVWVGSSRPSPTDFEVVRVNEGVEDRVRFELEPLPSYGPGRRSAYLVELAEVTTPGEIYRFRTSLFARFRDDPSVQERELRVSEDSLFLDGGAIEYRVSEPAVTPVDIAMGGSCSASIEAIAVKAEVVLPAELEEFREHLMFQTLLDGEPRWTPRSSVCSVEIPGRSWRGAGRDLFYRWCPGEHGVPEGMHTSIQTLAYPAGGQQVMTESARFELVCVGSQ